MSDGNPALLARADNLNVAGPDASRAGEVGDELVEHIRGVGFAVREIEGPSVDAVALGHETMGRER
eukprot:6954831-Pyramimonas_sp.AAC.1